MTSVEFLAEWMIRSAILIASGALLLWLLRVKDSPTRAVVWTAILCGSLAIPALTWAFPENAFANDSAGGARRCDSACGSSGCGLGLNTCLGAIG